MPQGSLQGIFAFRMLLSLQYGQDDKESSAYKGQVLRAAAAYLASEEQAKISEGLSHGEGRDHRQRNRNLKKRGHRACYQAVNGHGKGEEDGLLPGKAVALVGVSFHRIAVNIDDEA